MKLIVNETRCVFNASYRWNVKSFVKLYTIVSLYRLDKKEEP